MAGTAAEAGLRLLDLFGASNSPRQGLTFRKGAWRFKEDLLHTIVAQDDDHELDMVALLHQTSADGFTYGGFLGNGDSV